MNKIINKYLVPAIIFDNWNPIIGLIGRVFLIGYFFLPHVGAQMSLGQLESEMHMQKYRLDRLERLVEDYSKDSRIGWDKIGTVCGVLVLVGGLLAAYIRGQIKIGILSFANEVAKDLDDKFVNEKTYESGMKRVLSELESIKESQRRIVNATKHP